MTPHVGRLFLSISMTLNAIIDQCDPGEWPGVILTYEVWMDLCMNISANRVDTAPKKQNKKVGD